MVVKIKIMSQWFPGCVFAPSSSSDCKYLGNRYTRDPLLSTQASLLSRNTLVKYMESALIIRFVLLREFSQVNKLKFY